MMPHDVTQADCAAVDQWVREWKDCVGWHPALLQAFAAHRIAAIAEERARVVFFIRRWSLCEFGYKIDCQEIRQALAELIERGDHIQEK